MHRLPHKLHYMDFILGFIIAYLLSLSHSSSLPLLSLKFRFWRVMRLISKQVRMKENTHVCVYMYICSSCAEMLMIRIK